MKKSAIFITLYTPKIFLNFLGHRRRRNTTRKSLYLWEFLFGLLEDRECTPFICWTNRRDGEFALKDTDELAKLWGTVKNRPLMDKDKLFRAIRTYYNRGMLRKVTCLNHLMFCELIHSKQRNIRHVSFAILWLNNVVAQVYKKHGRN